MTITDSNQNFLGELQATVKKLREQVASLKTRIEVLEAALENNNRIARGDY